MLHEVAAAAEAFLSARRLLTWTSRGIEDSPNWPARLRLSNAVGRWVASAQREQVARIEAEAERDRLRMDLAARQVDLDIARQIAREKSDALAKLRPGSVPNESAPSVRQGAPADAIANADRVRRETVGACAKVVEKQASIHRMRAQTFADDGDRADEEARADDIDRAEAAAEALEYAASRVRALATAPFTRKADSDG